MVDPRNPRNGFTMNKKVFDSTIQKVVIKTYNVHVYGFIYLSTKFIKKNNYKE